MENRRMAAPAGQPQDPVAYEKALECLAGGLSKAEAARQSGYSEMHIHRLLRKPIFLAELEKRKASEPVSTADEKLALETLREMAENADQQKDRIAAAKALLDWSTRRKPKVTVTPVIKMDSSSPDEDEAQAAQWRGKKA